MGDDMHHANVLEEFLEPCLVEVRLVEEPERGGHGILGDDIRGESSISHTKRHRLPTTCLGTVPLRQSPVTLIWP